MNMHLIQLLGKWINVLFISVLSFFNVSNLKNSFKSSINLNINKDLSVQSIITDYSTIVQYNSSLPVGETKVIKEGKNGIIYKSDSSGEIVIRESESKIIEQGTKEESKKQTTTTTKPETTVQQYDTYKGRLTGYTGKCNGCSGTVACKTKNKKTWNLLNDGIYYNDDTYGLVRIIAATTEKFPCGSVIEISKSGYTPILGIVLDTGGSMRNAWKQSQTVWIDLAYAAVTGVDKNGISGKDITFKVRRLGW